jgi:hypothetical protein
MTKRLRNDARANDLERASERARGVAAEEGAGGGRAGGECGAVFHGVPRSGDKRTAHATRRDRKLEFARRSER